MSKVHIAADANYIGSVDSYNNSFTRFFAWIFGYSMAVDFGGKVRIVNKKSYTVLIQLLDQNATINNIQRYSIFKPIAEGVQLPNGGRKMRHVIAIKDRQALFEKLAIAISRGDTAKAMLMIGKGADVDIVYYDRTGFNPSFSSDTSDLNPHSEYTFTAFRAAPILQASQKGHMLICNFLKDVGANLSISGKQYNFKREIAGISSYIEYVPESSLVPSYLIDPDSCVHDSIRYQSEFSQIQERTVVHTQDSRFNETTYQLARNLDFKALFA